MVSRIPFFILLVALATGCDQDASHVLPRYSGAPGEIICVMPDQLYEGRAGDIIHNFFTDNYPLLPQGEPRFDLIQFNRTQVSGVTRHHRNMMFIHLSNEIDTPRVEAERNKWSSEQLVVDVYAGSIDAFDSLMQENGRSIAEKFNQFERQRLQSYYKFNKSSVIADSLWNSHRLRITVPSDCDIAKDRSDFVWIKRQKQRPVSGTMHDVVQGIFIYHYPYVNDSAFTRNQILLARDSVLKQHVPGPVDGSFMTTEYLLPPESYTVNLNDEFAVETRGLWRTEGAVMGGPFISLTTLDEVSQRVVCAEGFVFAPNFDKREYLREVEAMIYSLELPDNK